MLRPDKPESLVGQIVRKGDRLGVFNNAGRTGKHAFVIWDGCDWPVLASWDSIELAVVGFANNGDEEYHGN